MADTLILVLLAAIVLTIFLLVDLFRRVKRLTSLLLAKTITEPQPPSTSCSHVLVPIACQPLKSENLPIAYAQTILLKRCQKCAIHVDIGYAGDWTIEDFLKTESSAAKETEILERMMRWL